MGGWPDQGGVARGIRTNVTCKLADRVIFTTDGGPNSAPFTGSVSNWKYTYTHLFKVPENLSGCVHHDCSGARLLRLKLWYVDHGFEGVGACSTRTVWVQNNPPHAYCTNGWIHWRVFPFKLRP